jgi:peptidoglycan/LPS O-acetylase OafA/YrhL
MLASTILTGGWQSLQSTLARSRTVAGTERGRFARVPAVTEVRLSYSPGLDGLRAIAVMAVLLYHADLGWIPGGFLGVEIFFVISGYLISALLLAEWRRTGRIDLKDFWLRRARRLLPALYVLLVAVLAFALVFLPGEVARLRDDALAALGYVTNWYLIVGQESYFEAVGRPSLLQHLWSLAVEEQFYLIWPMVLAGALGFGATRRGPGRVLALAVFGAAASAALTALLYVPGADPSRIYYGTDTRATGLLCGAALAFAWSPQDVSRPAAKWAARRSLRLGRFARRWWPAVPLLLDAVGVAALAALVLFCLHLGEYQPLLYRGGLVAVALATAAMVVVVAHPRAWVVSRLLGSAPMRWVGVRSYGIYLWHWPVFMVTRPELDVPFDGLPLLALHLGLTLVLADLSYRFVERPIRRGALGRAWKMLREARGAERRRLRLQWAGIVVPVVASLALLGVAVAQAEAPERPDYLAKKHVRIEAGGHGATHAGADKREKSERAALGAAVPRGRVTAIGDSVMLGAVHALKSDIPKLTTIDARESRQIPEATRVLKRLRASGKLGSVVIFHIGDNGIVTDREFDRMMKVLSGTRMVLVVNTTVPEGYQFAPNNEVLADGVARYPNKAMLVDWHARSAGHPEYFWDGLHLTPRGANAYARLISATYRTAKLRTAR